MPSPCGPWQPTQCLSYSAAPRACDSLRAAGVAAAAVRDSITGSAFRKVVIAARSPSDRYWVLFSTTSLIGPITVPRGDTPVFSNATTSRTSQSATLDSSADVSDGAYQFCTGIRPPARSSGPAGAPSAFRLE